MYPEGARLVKSNVTQRFWLTGFNHCRLFNFLQNKSFNSVPVRSQNVILDLTFFGSRIFYLKKKDFPVLSLKKHPITMQNLTTTCFSIEAILQRQFIGTNCKSQNNNHKTIF